MLLSKRKHRPPFSRSSKAFRRILSARMTKKKLSSSLVISSEIGAAALGSSISGTFNSALASFPVGSPLVPSGFFPLKSVVVSSSLVDSVVVASGPAPPGQSGLPTSPGIPCGSGSSSVEISPSTPLSSSRQASEVDLSHIDALSNGISTGAFDVLARISSDDCGDDLFLVSVDEAELEVDRTDPTFLDASGAVVKVAHVESSPEVTADATLATDSTGCKGSAEQKHLLDKGLDSEHLIHPVEDQDRDNPFFLVKNRKSGRKVTKRH
uniref:Uncharacterized protein n=1 Tax=Brassica campestris TaxID=3711 RepID=M4EJW1_BRACM